jgi:hypothetical protein
MCVTKKNPTPWKMGHVRIALCETHKSNEFVSAYKLCWILEKKNSFVFFPVNPNYTSYSTRYSSSTTF